MGCCYSLCKEDNASQNGEANERTHLLVDPVSNSTTIQRVHSDDFLACYPNSLPNKKTDEQSALNRILQETATNVIDVAGMAAHNLEQHEYQDRMKLYAAKMAAGVKDLPKRLPSLLLDIPAPDKVLSAPPINIADYLIIQSALQKASVALAQIKVEHSEDLVVPFRIP